MTSSQPLYNEEGRVWHRSPQCLLLSNRHSETQLRVHQIANMPSASRGGLILVIGANGCIVSLTIQVLLQHGYRVRGTVRSMEANSWISVHYGPNFGLVQVQDMNDDAAFDSALKGVDGVAHIAMNMALDPHDLTVIDTRTKTLINVLEAASKEPSVKRVVWTSSMYACD